MSFRPNMERELATGDVNGLIRIWDVATQKQLRSWQAHDHHGIHELVFSSDGSMLASAASDGTARVWRVSNGRQLAELNVGGDVRSVSFGRDGSRLASVTVDGRIDVWDTALGRKIMEVASGRLLKSVRFSLDDKSLIMGAGDGTVYRADIDVVAMPVPSLLYEACSRRLASLSLLTSEEAARAGAAVGHNRVDVCDQL
jgi:WD40 repeat protein